MEHLLGILRSLYLQTRLPPQDIWFYLSS
jgi:hypothetical protein